MQTKGTNMKVAIFHTRHLIYHNIKTMQYSFQQKRQIKVFLYLQSFVFILIFNLRKFDESILTRFHFLELQTVPSRAETEGTDDLEVTLESIGRSDKYLDIDHLVEINDIDIR